MIRGKNTTKFHNPSYRTYIQPKQSFPLYTCYKGGKSIWDIKKIIYTNAVTEGKNNQSDGKAYLYTKLIKSFRILTYKESFESPDVLCGGVESLQDAAHLNV